LHFDASTVDAGDVYTGTRLACRFRFVNEGTANIELQEVRGSCGCLTPRLAQRIYRPGETGTIELEVNTFSQADGPHSWALHLELRNGERSEEQTLELRARLITEVRIQPAALVVVADRQASGLLTITDLRPQPLSIKESRSSVAGVNLQMGSAERDAQGHWLCRASIRVSEELANGRHDGFLEFVSDDPRYPLLRVPLTVIKRYQQRLSATPAEVTLVAGAGQPFPARLVLIGDQEGQKVDIERVTADDPGIHCRWADGPGYMATVRIQADRGAIHGELQTLVHVQIRRPLAASIDISVHCLATGDTP
jgi:hypothetical protein